MNNPIENAALLFEPQMIGNFILCFDADGSYWLAFINVERVYARDEQVYVSTSNGDHLLAARRPNNAEVEEAVLMILEALSANDYDKEKDDE